MFGRGIEPAGLALPYRNKAIGIERAAGIDRYRLVTEPLGGEERQLVDLAGIAADVGTRDSAPHDIPKMLTRSRPRSART